MWADINSLIFIKISNRVYPIAMRTQEVFKAIADPTRRQVLKMLQDGSKTAGEIAEAFEITKGSLSHHFNVLKAADLVRVQRRGQQIIYSLNTSVFEDVASLLFELFRVDHAKAGRKV
jgi:ArsR family transcriptional regulator, arsenate/arsenite/antimonite-responsive transcriptional repressor